MLKIAGSSLAGLACAARLSRLGHEVTVFCAEADPIPVPSPVIALPAVWKDLFKKSGGHLQTELNRVGLDWAEAPPTRHLLTDGDTLDLPTERGAQFRAIAALRGESEATAWRDLLDSLDGVWRAFRRHALEGRAPIDAAARRALWLDRSLEEVAAGLSDPLADLVLDLAASPAAPGLFALPLIVERSFGRWQLVDAAGAAQPASRLVDLLQDRLAERGVTFATDLTGPFDIDCRPASPEPITLHPWPLEATAAGWLEVRDHNLAVAPARPDRPGTAADWLARTPIVGADGALRASADSPAGPEPWGQLGSAALAVYELHERLTGEDCRPTNVAFTLPRLPRR